MNRRRNRSRRIRQRVLVGLLSALLAALLVTLFVMIHVVQPTHPAATEPSLMQTQPTAPSTTEAPYELNIQIIGENQVTVEFGRTYTDPGAKAQAVRTSDGDTIDLIVRIENHVDWTRLGVYRIIYTAEYEGESVSVERTVQIVDTTAPVIELVPQQQIVFVGEPYEEDGFTAMDNYDGDVTRLVQRVEKDGVVTYTVTDTSGNTATAQRIIRYTEMEGPVLILKGEEHMTIQAGREWVEPGYTAMDGAGNDLTNQVEISGTVNWYAAGTYTLKYRVVDQRGKEATAQRTVVVEPIRQPDVVNPTGKVIYLTFDDGPVANTKRLLKILETYNVKATFFVSGRSEYSLLDDIVKGGHAIGLHSMTHEYEKIYSSDEVFFEDMYAIQNVIYEHTGVWTKLMRFPGGSSNRVSKKYNVGIMTRLTQAVKDQGFRYFDWNVDSDDAGNTTTAEGVAQNVINGVKNKKISVVLQHDIKGYSVDAVEQIIIWGLENGYTFLALDETSPVCEHDVKN